jgi:hypothetical protein
MDPFLEHPRFFPGLHGRLVPAISDSLQTCLPEPYYAEISERVWVEFSHRLIEPDVDVLRPAGGPVGRQPFDGGIAVAAPARAEPVLIHVPHDEVREPFVEIYTRREQAERLVTTIEVLSLSNKSPGQHGRDLYERKQREVLRSQVHLVEIDLLRGGEHTTAVPRDRAIAEAGPFDYHVCIHRFDNQDYFGLYPVLLPAQLPVLAIPLLPGDPTVPLDLQAVLDRCYDAGPYRRRVRYAEDQIVPPLRPEQAEWAQRVLREKGLVPSG